LGRRHIGKKLARLERILMDLRVRGELAEEIFLDNETDPERVVVRLHHRDGIDREGSSNSSVDGRLARRGSF